MAVIEMIELEKVLPSRHRPLRDDHVRVLAESMRELGLLQPIMVRRGGVPVRGIYVDGFVGILGDHRAAAARLLGWTSIPAIIMDDDGLRAELAGIDENLMRAELTPSQRSAAIKRRRDIWQQLHPEPVQSGTNCSALSEPKTGRGHKQFAAETASAAGMTKQDINRHLHRADALGPDLDAVQGTSLDKGVELDALAKLDPADRAPLIQRAQTGEKVSARLPLRPTAVATVIPEAPTAAANGPTAAHLQLARALLAAIKAAGDGMDLGELADALRAVGGIGTASRGVIVTLYDMARHDKATARSG